MSVRFLLIGNPEESVWPHRLAQALRPLGEVHILAAEDALTRAAEQGYDVAIVDATAVEQVEALVSHLRAHKPDSRIVVLTASPTWQRARAAFEAGAIDYVPKTFDTGKLLATFQQVMRKPLPRWPR